MTDRRLKLHEILCGLLGSRNVYYQPPESVKMEYPAIRYYKKNIVSKHADNIKYSSAKCYEIIVISKQPDSEVIDKILELPYSSFDRHYKSNNLNHDVMTLYF
jgi:hypothetical protein